MIKLVKLCLYKKLEQAYTQACRQEIFRLVTSSLWKYFALGSSALFFFYILFAFPFDFGLVYEHDINTFHGLFIKMNDDYKPTHFLSKMPVNLISIYFMF